MLFTGGFNLKANVFKSSHLCQPLFEGIFTITSEEATQRKLPFLDHRPVNIRRAVIGRKYW